MPIGKVVLCSPHNVCHLVSPCRAGRPCVAADQQPHHCSTLTEPGRLSSCCSSGTCSMWHLQPPEWLISCFCDAGKLQLLHGRVAKRECRVLKVPCTCAQAGFRACHSWTVLQACQMDGLQVCGCLLGGLSWPKQHEQCKESWAPRTIDLLNGCHHTGAGTCGVFAVNTRCVHIFNKHGPLHFDGWRCM